MTKKALAKKAEKLGIHVETVACATCRGAGEMLRPDPLDLRRLRETHVSKYDFARNVLREDGQKGISIGFLAMVEAGERQCPEWLLLEYLAIPTKKWESGKPWARLQKMSQKEREKALETARARRKAKQDLAKAERPITRGQTWERLEPPVPRRTVVVLSVASETVTVRPIDQEKATPRIIRKKTLLRRYQNITALPLESAP